MQMAVILRYSKKFFLKIPQNIRFMSVGNFVLVGPTAMRYKVSLAFYLKEIIHRLYTAIFNSVRRIF